MFLLNPTYESLRPFLEQPEALCAQGTLIHRGRNRLYRVEVEGVPMCIKCFGQLNIFKRFIYRYFRKPKGLRAWEHAHILHQAGFVSPQNIAYWQTQSCLGVENEYYICLYQEGQTLYRWGNLTLKEIQTDVEAFAKEAARLHNAGILLCDFTPGNILRTTDGFAFVDTNRMRQGRVSIRQGLLNMAGLWIQPEVADYLTEVYIQARGGTNVYSYKQLMRKYRKDFWLRFARRHHLTNAITHRDLNGDSFYYSFATTIQ